MDDDWLARHFDNMDKSHNQTDAEFRRLCAEPSSVPASKGDRVVVAAGFVGLGHLWVREEAEVMECGDTSVKVRFIHYTPYNRAKGTLEMWVHPALITDVLKEKGASK